MANDLANIQTFQFNSFDKEDLDSNVVNYELKEITGDMPRKERLLPSVIREERAAAKSTGFRVEDVIYEYRGLKKQEHEDFEIRVENEIEKRLAAKIEEAIQTGFEKGQKLGFEKAYQEAAQEHSQKINELEAIINEVQEHKKEIFAKNQLECFEMVRSLAKWITLKEMQDDDYLKRLLEKLVHEIGSKANLLIKVNRSRFHGMDEIIKAVEDKLGVLTNVRVEVGQEMEQPGIIIESASSILKADLKSQFDSIDEVFKSVGLKQMDNDLKEIGQTESAEIIKEVTTEESKDETEDDDDSES